jgi:tellurite resistance protein TehA-like permease
MLADYSSHAKAPGYFTLVAGTCVLGNDFVLLAGQSSVGWVLWAIGVSLWCLLTYTMLPVLISAEKKPHPEQAIGGAWLLAVVGTQAVSVLTSLLVPSLPVNLATPALFLSLVFWLVGSMLYIWLISLIFYRIVFLPLVPSDLTPPYWINMGAMAISTLAGVWLIRAADRLPLVTELLPFLKGLTLMFWATATWWIPLLLMLGAWRHVRKRFPLAYEHGYWAAVFPLGMYTVCTQRLIDTFNLPFLQPIATTFGWISLVAWTATFLGLLDALGRRTWDRSVSARR